ncbi:MAG: hypothetical protein HY606_14885 [Planctomycetes bacterium]|nr:hypothetical protein [Planctomycetota bacterium]
MSKIRIRHGDNEIELEGSADFMKKHLEQFYQKISVSSILIAPKIKQEILEPITKTSGGKKPTPAEFFKSKGKTDGISQILIFGKYLEEFEGLSEFSIQDVNRLAKDAKFPKDVHPQYFANAVKQGLLRIHGRSKYSLTLSAEEILAAM